MISTLHGNLPVLIEPVSELPMTVRGRADICTLSGKVMGQYLHCTLTLDSLTGEMLLFSADGFVGSFRLGDLIVAQVAAQLSKAQTARREAGNVPHSK